MKGFGGLSPERRRAVASLGGLKSHAKGTAHEWTAQEASAAGRKSWRDRRTACDKDSIIRALKATVADLQRVVVDQALAAKGRTA